MDNKKKIIHLFIHPFIQSIELNKKKPNMPNHIILNDHDDDDDDDISNGFSVSNLILMTYIFFFSCIH